VSDLLVYLPTTLAGLAEYDRGGEIPGSEERFTADGDDEQAEYDALMAAAEASAELLHGPGRRVVVVAQVPRPTGPIPMRRVVAVHVDTEDGADPDDDLAWYATQEIPDLVAGLG
jgi:hypothetical protein